MIFYINLGIFAASWLVSVGSSVLAIRWTLFAARGRMLPAAMLSLSALAIGCLGTTHFYMTWESWTNGQLQHDYDTRRFFIAPLVLGSFALVCTVWKKVRSQVARARR